MSTAQISGAIVTKSVDPYAVAVGNPARIISDVRKVRHKVTGKPVYPWRENFSHYMPWEGIGFETWYAGLDLEEKQARGIEDLAE